ncbi:MAG: YcaQ family DNA glycosylase [Bacteroidetes bacterium]|nr:YcaQ family DNA glycosylase [Bacteroidota bacterium]
MRHTLPVFSAGDVKRYALHAQGLLQKGGFGKGREGTLNTLEHLGYVQLDTLAVVARAHHHTLYTRTAGYDETHLAGLLADKKVFEYWSHAASYLPMRDYRFSLVRKQLYRNGQQHWFVSHKKLLKYVLDRITAEGPLQARHFETDRKRGSWFDWKPAKVALEQLFMDGTLMVSARQGFQKVYDLAGRVLPEGMNTSVPDAREYAAYLIESTLRAHGFATAGQMTYLRRNALVAVKDELQQQTEAKQLISFHLHGSKEVYYARPDLFEQKNKPAKHIHLLSPFDNLLIQRSRTKLVFGYDYQVECYVPEAKRKFGYFCLPILWNGDFIGRLDPKADKKAGVFYIRSLHIEFPPKQTEAFFNDLKHKLREFAAFNGCHEVVCEKAVPLKWRKQLK